ncbi:hypothetical protein [Microbulbifer hydrolyticus]|uniref:LysM repeat protein n=1 Tax=Microbulbifer hydrolyticus TaxID=48074 RepID=A0A6P1T720_9GAMM|nr:hypothetical protein [Microbulbifer hydrolyticus]MBB5211668.1 LysM repeat protein [Microbulbifer hydrolyticus]QHQ37601.1 hypothetical protein GTQ55_00475 [Microbulbifer hydrolyticus]
MPYFELTDRQGRRYRLSAEIRYFTLWADPEELVLAENLLASTEPSQLLMAEHHFFGAGGDYPYLHRLGPGTPGNASDLFPLTPAASPESEQILLEAIRRGQLTLEPLETGKARQSGDERNALRVKIRLALAEIISQERLEATNHSRSLAAETRVTRGLIYTGAFFNGLWNAGTDFAKWLKEVNDVVNPTQRILRTLQAGVRAEQRNSQTGEGYLNAFVAEQLTSEKRQLVEALGFDPSSITVELFEQALQIADIVWQDQALRDDIRRFAFDYVNAQHPLELTEFSGTAAFEVLFTIALAAVTAGAGLAAGAAGQARHFARFRKVGDLLRRYASEAVEAAKRKTKTRAGSNTGASDFNTLPRDEVVVKPVATPESKPPNSRSKANTKNADEKSTAQNRSEIPKRARPEPDNWKTYKTHGVDQTPMASAVGREMVAELESQGMSRAQAVMKAQEYLASGSELPVKKTVKKGETLYKLVPEGEAPGKYSAYFAELSDINGFEGVSYDEITDAIGIPLESQQTPKFDLVEVEALEDVTVYQSTIAPTTQNGYSQPGGGTQTLIVNRSRFSDPKSTGRKFP